MWQSIETAPKRGEPYIIVALTQVRGVRGRVDVAYWDEDDACWYSATNHNGYEGEKLSPTHWMPLPEPPLISPSVASESQP